MFKPPVSCTILCQPKLTSPAESSYETSAPGDISVAALWETLKQRTQRSWTWILDPQILWDNECVFLCHSFYSAISNSYSHTSHKCFSSDPKSGNLTGPRTHSFLHSITLPFTFSSSFFPRSTNTGSYCSETVWHAPFPAALSTKDTNRTIHSTRGSTTERKQQNLELGDWIGIKALPGHINYVTLGKSLSQYESSLERSFLVRWLENLYVEGYALGTIMDKVPCPPLSA